MSDRDRNGQSKFTATRIAQYSLSLPAKPVQIKTYSRHYQLRISVAKRGNTDHSNTTRQTDEYQAFSETRFIREECSYQYQVYYVSRLNLTRCPTGQPTMPTITNGTTIHLRKMLNEICIQISPLRKTRCSVRDYSLQSIGYIIISSPTAIQHFQYALPLKSSQALTN